MLSDRSFVIPEYGEEREQLMGGAYDFISEMSGCSYTYQLVMADSSAVPSYFDINQLTGAVTFSNMASNAVDEYIGIVIVATDGYNNLHTYRTEYFRVTSECGLRSTQVLPPT